MKVPKINRLTTYIKKRNIKNDNIKNNNLKNKIELNIPKRNRFDFSLEEVCGRYVFDGKFFIVKFPR